MAATLDELSQKKLINVDCMWNQHGLRIIVFWILRERLQPTYIGHPRSKEPVKEQRKNKERTKNKKKKKSGVKELNWNGHLSWVPERKITSIKCIEMDWVN